MKTSKIKLLSVATLLLASISMFSGPSAHAQVTSGNPFEEGTQTTLTPAQISVMKSYLQNSRASLQDLLSQVQSLGYQQSKTVLLNGIRDVVVNSAPKTTETLLRYVLNRALKVVGRIDSVSNATGTANVAGVIDQEVRVLKRSVEMALEYYESDIAFINSQGSNRRCLPYAQFGVRYADFLMQVNESLLNSMAAYAIASDALGFLQVDLYTDQNRDAYGIMINKLYNFLQVHPLSAPSSSIQAVNQMRQLRKLHNQVNRDLTQVSIGEAR